VVQTMRGELASWYQDMNAQLPEINTQTR